MPYPEILATLQYKGTVRDNHCKNRLRNDEWAHLNFCAANT
jgi:hypothetical protein